MEEQKGERPAKEKNVVSSAVVEGVESGGAGVKMAWVGQRRGNGAGSFSVL